MKPSVKWILSDQEPILKQKAKPLDIHNISNDEQKLINKMIDYVDACFHQKHKKLNIRAGIALAGNQVGLLKQVIYIHFLDNKIEHKHLLANPKIVAESQLAAYVGCGEGCLSVQKDYPGIVKRKNHIIVKAYDLLNHKDVTIDATGLLSICLQHEIDHLHGILYYEKINNKLSPSDWIKY